MKYCFNILMVSILFSFGCTSQRNNSLNQGNKNDAPQNAINNFLQSKASIKNDSVFSLRILNIDSDILGISILGCDNKLLPSKEDRIGTNRPNFPTRYLIQEDKLFYWYDSTHTITKELIAALVKFNQIDSINVNGFKGMPTTVIDDSRISTAYFFCKQNLLKYKKVRTKRAMGSYKPPKLICN